MMEIIEYSKIKVLENDEYIDELLKLSKAWADEKSCPAYYENEPSELESKTRHKLHEGMECICYENHAVGIYFIQDPDGYRLEIIPERK